MNNEVLREAKEAYNTALSLLLDYAKGQSGGKTFYAHFIMRMNLIWDDKRVPTAGVSVTDRINLYINPDFFLKLDPLERMELLQHEVEHIVYLHPTRAKDYLGDKPNQNTFKLFNVATDANINQNLPNITKNFGVTIQRVNDQLKEMGSKDRLDPKDHAEVHYEYLLRNQVDPEQSQGGEGELDDHSIWEESSGNAELVKAVVKDTANAAQQAAGISNTPNHLAQAIGELSKNLVNWKAQLRQFFANARRHERVRTRSRRNRRYGIHQAGRKKNPILHVAVCLDSSGSVSDKSFTQFFSELEAIAKEEVEITVLDADSEVAAVYKYKPKQKVERKGRGGTAYSPAIKKAKELGVDGIIYFGDMDAADKPEDPRIAFLWAIVGTQNPPASFGRQIRITEER
jgi:predicted metal-dependent peptidase